MAVLLDLVRLAVDVAVLREVTGEIGLGVAALVDTRVLTVVGLVSASHGECSGGTREACRALESSNSIDCGWRGRCLVSFVRTGHATGR